MGSGILAQACLVNLGSGAWESSGFEGFCPVWLVWLFLIRGVLQHARILPYCRSRIPEAEGVQHSEYSVAEGHRRDAVHGPLPRQVSQCCSRPIRTSHDEVGLKMPFKAFPTVAAAKKVESL